MLSIVIPVYNEEDNISPLQARIVEVLQNENYSYEVVLVNDGSQDRTGERLDELAASDPRFKVVHLRRNYGQTAAMMAGFDHASGDIICPMDGDLQNDPADIPRLLAKLDEGYDVCSGWRKDRRDNTLTKVIPSKIANWLISRISGVPLHDYGCSLKAYKADFLDTVRIYGEMHRFIPIYASWEGARVTEIPVTHHPRIHGVSKYGLERVFKVILDLIVIRFRSEYHQKPIYLYGMFGLLNGIAAVLGLLLMVYYKLWGGKSFVETPLPNMVVTFINIGIMSMLLGLLADLQMRTYYESQDKRVYRVGRTVNLESTQK
jgi:glycosyltransferase involved in cell wall biosynthesis